MRKSLVVGILISWSVMDFGGASIAPLVGAPVTVQPPARGDGGLTAVLAQVEAAQAELVRGRPDAFKALWSHADDVTLVGGLGGAIATGWTRVSQRLDWVSSQYANGSRTHEEVARVVGQDVAYVVQRETIRFRPPGQTRRTTQELRTTMVFRFESGSWRIVHRHADSQIAKQPAQ